MCVFVFQSTLDHPSQHITPHYATQPRECIQLRYASLLRNSSKHLHVDVWEEGNWHIQVGFTAHGLAPRLHPILIIAAGCCWYNPVANVKMPCQHLSALKTPCPLPRLKTVQHLILRAVLLSIVKPLSCLVPKKPEKHKRSLQIIAMMIFPQLKIFIKNMKICLESFQIPDKLAQKSSHLGYFHHPIETFSPFISPLSFIEPRLEPPNHQVRRALPGDV